MHAPCVLPDVRSRFHDALETPLREPAESLCKPLVFLQEQEVLLASQRWDPAAPQDERLLA